jgi:hypothetical protein
VIAVVAAVDLVAGSAAREAGVFVAREDALPGRLPRAGIAAGDAALLDSTLTVRRFERRGVSRASTARGDLAAPRNRADRPHLFCLSMHAGLEDLRLTSNYRDSSTKTKDQVDA